LKMENFMNDILEKDWHFQKLDSRDIFKVLK